MNVSRFEDLEIWQIAREICKIVYKISSSGPFGLDYKLRDQIRASSGSAMDNIAEGFNRGGNKEFYQFLSFTLGSAGETRSQTYRAYDVGYINDETYDLLLEQTDSLCRKTWNLMQHLKSSDIKGPKFT